VNLNLIPSALLVESLILSALNFYLLAFIQLILSYLMSFRPCRSVFVGVSLSTFSVSTSLAQTPFPPSAPPAAKPPATQDIPAAPPAIIPTAASVAPPEVIQAIAETPPVIVIPEPILAVEAATIVAEPAAPIAADAQYIDRTEYQLGATTRSRELSVPSVSTASVARPEIDRRSTAISINSGSNPVAVSAQSKSVAVGPVRLSASGISLEQPRSETVPVPASIAFPQPVNPGKPYFAKRLLQSPVSPVLPLSIGFPIAIPAPITSLFGWRVHPISGVPRLHAGTDIGAAMGAPVLAAAAGNVMLADNLGGYGLAVALEHQGGMQQTLYAHLSEIYVKPGEIVQQGTVIGRVGSTGASTGPHLHFEVRELTPNGWVARDAGATLELAMNRLVQALQIARAR
jgi:murein DD-endopeptidase MepM/ murein hydrolase activator NlpD